MNTNNNIQEKIESTLHALDNLQDVKAPPFFKDKTMQRLFTEKEEVASFSIWSWFTPKLQLATLACVVLINVYAFNQIKVSDYNEGVSSFAAEYGLSTESNSSIINL